MDPSWDWIFMLKSTLTTLPETNIFSENRRPLEFRRFLLETIIFRCKLGVSKNRGTPKSSILIGFSLIFTIHFGGFPSIFGNTQLLVSGRAPWAQPLGFQYHQPNELRIERPDFSRDVWVLKWFLGRDVRCVSICVFYMIHI